MTKMFFDTKSPNGLLFTAKQNVLSRIATRNQAARGPLNEGIYLPTSTILQSGAITLGGHLNKQGIDPFRPTGLRRTQGGIFGLFGISDPLGLPVYSEVVNRDEDPEENRLVSLTRNKFGQPTITQNPTSALQRLLSSVFQSSISRVFGDVANNLSSGRDFILEYPGGPQSALGIGKTVLTRVTYTDEGTDYNKKPSFRVQNYQTLSYSQIANRQASKSDPRIGSDFRKELTGDSTFNNLTNGLDYGEYNIERRVNLGDPGKKKNKTSYVRGDETNGALDKITAFNLYKSSGPTTDTVKNDLVKFRIGVIQNNDPSQKVYIHFRAFLDSMADDYHSNWNPHEFMGRGEKFYRYSGFDRRINLGWTVVAQSKQELIPMYQKLNYLASVLTPDYSGVGYMSGNLVTLTVGGYLYEQPGFIESINYDVPSESPWEIAIPDGEEFDSNQGIATDNFVKELPHMIRVTGFSFVPIHEFVPRVQRNEYFDGDGALKGHGRERYISLSNGFSTNYLDRELQRPLEIQAAPIARPESEITAPLLPPNFSA